MAKVRERSEKAETTAENGVLEQSQTRERFGTSPKRKQSSARIKRNVEREVMRKQIRDARHLSWKQIAKRTIVISSSDDDDDEGEKKGVKVSERWNIIRSGNEGVGERSKF